MKAVVTVEMSSGAVQIVTIAVPDFIRWEKTYKTRTSQLAESWSMEDWSYLAWSSLKRRNEVSVGFDEWVGDVAEVRLEDDAARPT